ncbi:MAG: RNA polymerase subunit sigma-24, partial [Deltaproteobacteria bacterium]|nr:RNA polymerase subunit sigma-24 [Deltaproteobacteria bacterium]
MERYVEGDARAFDRLYEEVAPWLRGRVRAWVHERTAAEDLLQATFLKVHVARHAWRPGGSVKGFFA